MTEATLTLMAVHAHPDDEASSTGGILARYSAEGIRTVLVTCTNGELGDGHETSKPGDIGHDEAWVVATRRRELEASCEILGVSSLEMLGYRDSGMMGWPQNEDPASFWQTPVDVAAKRLADILLEERPQVIVTYNEIGFYGHPDHIQAHRITLAALPLLDYEPTLYFNAIPNSVMARFRERWEQEELERREANAAKGIEEPQGETSNEPELDIGTPDELIGAAIDVSSATDAKHAALAAHASQMADAFWLKMSPEDFKAAMGVEWFVRVTNPLALEGVVTDIFAGYR